MRNLSLSQRRVTQFIASLLCGICAANYFFELNFFGSYDKLVAMFALSVFVIIAVRVFPSNDELKEDWERRKSKRSIDDL